MDRDLGDINQQLQTSMIPPPAPRNTAMDTPSGKEMSWKAETAIANTNDTIARPIGLEPTWPPKAILAPTELMSDLTNKIQEVCAPSVPFVLRQYRIKHRIENILWFISEMELKRRLWTEMFACSINPFIFAKLLSHFCSRSFHTLTVTHPSMIPCTATECNPCAT